MTLRVIDPQNVQDINPNSQVLTLPETPTVFRRVDFSLDTAVQISGPLTITEGSQITSVAVLNVPTSGTSLWTVSGGPILDFSDPSRTSFDFTPAQDGIYTLTYNYTMGAENFVVTRHIEVRSVAPIAHMGNDLTAADAITEGRLQLTRTMIMDPGADTWNVSIDYGDGSAMVNNTGLTTRQILLDHLYPNAGSYVITLTVSNEEGSSTDTLLVDVLPGSPQLNILPPAELPEGEERPFIFTLIDATQQASIADWAFDVHWGDGRTESVAAAMLFGGSGDRVGAAIVNHRYAVEGSYTVRFLVKDEDGDVFEISRSVLVTNAKPIISLDLAPTSTEEDAASQWTASAVDVDANLVFNWDFGDGTVSQTGSSVTHTFTAPGTYTVTLSVSDGVDSSTATHEVNVTNTPDAPVITPTGVLRLTEQQLFTTFIHATDDDPSSHVQFTLENAPDGLTINATTGLLSWQPTADQAGQRYLVDVVAVDDTNLSTRSTVELLVDSASRIDGRVFYDHNSNGRVDAFERAITGIVVTLDRGADGTIDATTTTSASGEYLFEGLGVGFYRVQIATPPQFTATTPLQYALDISAPASITLSATGIAVPQDFGDAADAFNGTSNGNYQTRNLDLGPVHYLTNALRIGPLVTSETDAAIQTGDSGDDGLVSPSKSLLLSPGQAPSVAVKVTNQTGRQATLHGWIDYNGDGTFDSLTESASVLVPDGTAGSSVTLSFPIVPVDALSQTVYARFRLSTDASASSPTGIAIDGEVEDYVAHIRPASPVQLSPGNTTTSQRPVVSWTAIPEAVGYEIWIKNQSTGEHPYVRTTVEGTSWTPDFDLGVGRFYIWLRALGQNGNHSSWNAPSTVLIKTPPVINSIGPSVNSARPTISWTALPGAVHYEIWIRETNNPGGVFIREFNLPTPEWTPTADMPLGTYNIWVRGYAADNMATLWSSAIGLYVRPAPMITQGLNATFDRTPTIAWLPVTGAVTYSLQLRSVATGQDLVVRHDLVNSTFTVTEPLADGAYRLWVRASNARGFTSFWTMPIDFYVGGRPSLLTAGNQTFSSAPTINWGSVDGAASYELRIDQIGGQIQIVHETGLTETSFTPATALTAGTYRVWVRAISQSDEISPWSRSIDFIIAHSAAPVNIDDGDLPEEPLSILLASLVNPKMQTSNQQSQHNQTTDPTTAKFDATSRASITAAAQQSLKTTPPEAKSDSLRQTVSRQQFSGIDVSSGFPAAIHAAETLDLLFAEWDTHQGEGW